jgi:hypothetical protein
LFLRLDPVPAIGVKAETPMDRVVLDSCLLSPGP